MGQSHQCVHLSLAHRGLFAGRKERCFAQSAVPFFAVGNTVLLPLLSGEEVSAVAAAHAVDEPGVTTEGGLALLVKLEHDNIADGQL